MLTWHNASRQQTNTGAFRACDSLDQQSGMQTIAPEIKIVLSFGLFTSTVSSGLCDFITYSELKVKWSKVAMVKVETQYVNHLYC